jgi:carbonic anhydrase
MKKTISLLLLILFINVSCSENRNQSKVKNNHQTVTQDKHKDCNNVHWGYGNNDEGPDNWKNLCDEFAACGGKNQSPINIQTKKLVKSNDLKPIRFNYDSSKVDIINNGHTIQFNVSGENTTDINGKNYKLLQFHYHTLSEHTVDGNHFPMEVHLVQKNNDNDYAVIGIMFKEGKENALLKKYLDNLPAKNKSFKTDENFSLKLLLPDNKSYYYYKGSLTTPPCSEIVSWYVLKNPVEASKEQLEKMASLLHDNYRPIQALNGRKVYVFEQ